MLVLALVCCAFFWEAVSLRGVFFHYDHAIQNFPYRLFFARGLQAGHLPLWTPDIFCGFPLFAESQGNALYPPFLLLFRFLDPWVAYNYYHVLHFLLAGLFTYTLARVMHVGRGGSLLAGICYMLSGPVLFHSHHTNIVVGACWLPILLALMELAFRRHSLLALLGFAAATAALLLGAQPQYTLYCGLVCGLYLVWRLRLLQLTGGRRRRVVALVVAFGLAAALAAVLASVQVLPLMELVGHSSRATEAVALPRSIQGVPANLMTVFLPHYFGSPGLGSYWAHIDEGPYAELTLFLGVVPLLLALVGTLSDRSRKTLFFAALGTFAFIFSLGHSGSLYNAFWPLPVFESARFPSRFAFVTGLCVAILAGTGLDQLLRASNRVRVRRAAFASAAVILLLSTLCLAATAAYHADLMSLSLDRLASVLPLKPFSLEVMWQHLHNTLPADIWRLVAVAGAGSLLLLMSARRILPGRVAVAIWCVLVFGELALAGREFAPVTDPSIYSEAPELVEALRELPPGRILRYQYYDARLPSATGDYPHTRGWAVRPGDYAGSLDRLPHNANMIWGIPSVNGFSPLQTRALKSLLGRPKVKATLVEFKITPALNLLGARYILSPRDEIPGEFEHIKKVGAINIFRNPDALPRTFIVHRAMSGADTPGTLRSLRDGEFDYRREVLVHDSSTRLLSGEPGESDPSESAEIQKDTGDDIVVRARLERPGYLVLADQYYPGWHVAVDGEARELLRVDYLLKGVELDAGEHTVEFSFRPRSFRIGAVLSACGLAFLVGATFLCVLGKRRLPWRAGGEQEGLLRAPYTRKMACFAVLVGALFLVLGPVIRPRLWAKARWQLDPRQYVAVNAICTASYARFDGQYQESYVTIREACRWWPENPRLREFLVGQGRAAVVELLNEGDVEGARTLAAEINALAPEETQALAPALVALARSQ